MTESGDSRMTQSRLDIPGYTPLRGLSVDRAGALVEARSRRDGSRVVIRVLSPALAADKRSLRRLRHDVSRMAGVRHPNLVATIAFEARAGAVISQYTDGVTLRRIVEGSGPTPVEAGLVTLHSLLAALAALHSADVLHRDLRPDVVLVDATGGVRVRDSGVAAPPLHAGWAAGSPQYMAPELWRGAQHTVATDLYAAGALFFEALTGKPPFPASDLEDLKAQHESNRIPDDAVPEAVRGLVSLGLAKDPRQRPGSAAEYLLALEEAAGEHLDVGWYKTGEAWLSESVAARLADSQVIEPDQRVGHAPLLVGSAHAAPVVADPRPAQRVRTRRRRLAVAGGVGAAGCVAAALVAVGLSLLGHTNGTALTTSKAQDSASATPSLSGGSFPATVPGLPAPTLPDSASPGESQTPDESATPAPTFTPPPSGPPSGFSTPTPSESPSSSPSQKPTPCSTLPPVTPGPLPTPCL
jgi:serine/threonine protein kinase